MISQLSNKNISYLFTGIIFLMLNIVGLSWINQAHRVYLNEQQKKLFKLAQKQVFITQDKLAESLFASFTLAAAVNQAQGKLSTTQFKSVAQNLIQKYPQISSLQLAPQGVVSQVYPADASLIDRNHLADPRYQREAILARDLRQPNLAGPFIIAEKERLALVAHTPIFLDNQFWGFSLSLVWLDNFLANIGLEQSSQIDYIYQLSFKDSKTNGKTIFWQSDRATLINPVNVNISIPNGITWQLAIASRPKPTPFWYGYEGKIVIFLINLVITGGIYRLFRLPQQLNLKLQEKTSKLTQTNLSLEAAIRERQQIAQDLELWKRALTESSNGVVITGVIDEENKTKYPIEFVNHAFTRLTGYRLEEIQGQNCSFLQGEDTSPEALNKLRQALAEGESCNLVLKNYRKDKTPFWNELTISPIRDEAGKLTAFLGFQIDVSDRVEAKKALEKEYQKTLLLRQITSDIHQSLDTQTILQTTVDRLGKALKVDRCLIHIYQEAEKEMFCIAEYRKPNIASMAEVTIPIQNNPHAQKVINREEAVVANNVFSDPLFSDALNVCVQFDLKSIMAIRTISQDKVNGILAVHQCDYQRDWQPEDIELLESVASQLGIALTQAYLLVQETEKNEELEKARQIAESANQAKSEFLATMSHEIRTPMNAVMGMTSILLDDALNEQQKQYVTIIRNSGEDLLNIINDILDFSKIESGQLMLEEYSFELANCLTQCLDLLIHEANDKGLKILYLIKANVPNLIVGDETRIRQILVNLINNAIKFTEAGEIKILVTAKPINQLINAYEIIFQVQDTGIGIIPQEQQYLFESFRQVDASTTRKYRGTGVGLAICKKLAQMMGGNIWLESHGCIAGNPPVDWDENEDRLMSASHSGSIFAFSIAVKAISQPLNVNEPTNATWQQHQVNLSQKKDHSLQAAIISASHIRLLLVEDNHINQRVISLLLQKYGFRVDLVGNGLEALQSLENVFYEIILMDVQMPEMDGLTATSLIREKYESPNLPYIIAITAYAMKGDREKCLQAGMNDYVAKPIKELELVTALEKAVNALGLTDSLKPRESVTDIAVESDDDDHDIIDHYIIAQIKDLAGEDEDVDDFLSTLIVEYEDNARQILSELEKAITENYPADIESKSHRLASSSVTMGALKLSQLCRTLEKSALSMNTVEIEAIFTQIKQEFQVFLITLKKLCETDA